MFFLELILVFAIWLLFMTIVGTDFSKRPPRLTRLRFSLGALLITTTDAAILLGVAAVLTRLSS